jgi:hypothetical protein
MLPDELGIAFASSHLIGGAEHALRLRNIKSVGHQAAGLTIERRVKAQRHEGTYDA